MSDHRSGTHARTILAAQNADGTWGTAFHSMAQPTRAPLTTEQALRSGAMSSRMAQMNVIDILYTAYAFRLYDGLKQRLAETYIEKE